MQFKTFAKEGLMFLSVKDDSFLSVEMREGRVLFQVMLKHNAIINLPMQFFASYIILFYDLKIDKRIICSG